jgi:ABC-type uncharacterized transport system auxiliary subunit
LIIVDGEGRSPRESGLTSKPAKTAGNVMKHPASLWAVVVATATPALVDRYIVQPDKEEEQAYIEQAQWEELNETLIRLQDAVDQKWETSRIETHRIEIELTKLQTTVQLLTRGRRHEAKRSVRAFEPSSVVLPEPERETIELPRLDAVKDKAEKNRVDVLQKVDP